MHPKLAVHGPVWARAAVDIITVVALASTAAALWIDGVAVALFALVLLGLTVARVAALPAVLQLLLGTSLVAAAWASIADWYRTFGWLDIVAHLVANGLLAVVLIVVLWRTGALPRRLPSSGIIILTTALGALLAVLWEAGEWLGHTVLDDSIGVGYDDTIGDLACGTLGSFIAGIVLARRAGRG